VKIDHAIEAEAIADCKAGDILAGDRLVRMHEGLIHMAVRPYESPRCELADLLQTGRIALVDAVQEYDPARGSFATFALVKMKSAAHHYARAGRYIVRDGGPARASKDAQRLAVCLDSPIGDGGETLGDRLVAPAPDPMIAVDVESLVARLPRREREVLRRHYTGEGETLQQIGSSIGLSKERVRQIENDGIAMLRRRVAA
jgi:RNA polymerase sigma factor (sigma-70 family)